MCFSHIGHIMPSIFNVFSMVFFSFSFLMTFFSRTGCGNRIKFSLSALQTTKKLDKLIAAAPNIGFNCQPKIGSKAPAASGMPIML